MTGDFRVVYLANYLPPETGLPAFRITLPDGVEGSGRLEQHSSPQLGHLQIEDWSLQHIIQCCRRLEAISVAADAKRRIENLGKLERVARKTLSAFYDKIETTAKDGGGKLAAVRDISKNILAEQGIPEGPGEAIIHSIKRIFETRTVFLLPEIFVSTATRQPKNASPSISKFEELIELWAENSVHSMRESAAGQLTFAFAYFSELNRSPVKAPARTVVVPDLLSRKQLAKATNILGNSLSQMRRPGPVLLEGRTGSGKSTAAQIYAEQDSIPVVKINVSSTPKDLIEARLRGFLKGSFTGAINDQAGWFEQAENGVLFLDEFQQAPEMPCLGLQRLLFHPSKLGGIVIQSREKPTQFPKPCRHSLSSSLCR